MGTGTQARLCGVRAGKWDTEEGNWNQACWKFTPINIKVFAPLDFGYCCSHSCEKDQGSERRTGRPSPRSAPRWTAPRSPTSPSSRTWSRPCWSWAGRDSPAARTAASPAWRRFSSPASGRPSTAARRRCAGRSARPRR
uniref:Uncharacterized protein n=1 Tax=Chelonoidis abingdonii TaxID=106734 RepID=A0A8C0IS22_CHEAB